MKKLNGSELSVTERAMLNINLADRIQNVFADAASEITLTEDDIKSTLLNYLNASTGKDWHLSSSVTLHGDIEVSQQIQIAENNHTCKSYEDNSHAGSISTESYGSMSLITAILFWLNNTLTNNQFKDITLFDDEYTGEINLYKNGSHAVHIGINNKNEAFIGVTEENSKDKLTHRNKQIEKETLQKLLMGGALAHEDITLEERANKIARSIKTAFLILEDN
ncbi:hypothetical protein AB7Y93_15640 [Providencia manganoxydans]|uniref:hypothetical protein n=1 Tax=Providencia manganoxydans TaxID=2923283 RepID=UPI0034E56F1F